MPCGDFSYYHYRAVTPHFFHTTQTKQIKAQHDRPPRRQGDQNQQAHHPSNPH